MLYFVLLEAYFQLYGPLYDAFSERPAAFNAFRVLLATLVLLPPAALMGGTLPVLGQHVVRRPDELGRNGSWLYAVNTIGAAGGALLAGFVLPPALGLQPVVPAGHGGQRGGSPASPGAWRGPTSSKPGGGRTCRPADAGVRSAAPASRGAGRRPRTPAAHTGPAWLLAAVAGLLPGYSRSVSR